MSQHQALQNDFWPWDLDSPHVRNWDRGSPQKPSPSRESTTSFVTAIGDTPTSTAPPHIHNNEAVSSSGTSEPAHEIHNVMQARLISSINTPEFANGWCPHIAEAPILHRITSRCCALCRSALQAIWLAPSLRDHTSAPLEVEISYQCRTRLRGKGFSVLCLDGGGCRGYISLLILRHLLSQLEPEGAKKLFPYLYFDLICGTSTGGLITILLAILHLDIDTAINIYKSLISEVFARGFSKIRCLLKDAGYSRRPLKRAIAKILHGYAKERDGKKVTQMEDPLHNRGCRGIVTTTHCVGEERTVIALRSYTYSEGAKIPHHHNWTWDDAALATTAAPMFFKRHSITKDKHRFFFEDAGAHRINNPTKFALEECRKLDDADPQLHATKDCLFISLGTGTRKGASGPEAPGFCGFLQTKRAMAGALAKYATDVNDVHKSMQAAAAGTNSSISYHRLDPTLNYRIAMGDWKQLPAMENIASCYYGKKQVKFKECANALEQFQTAERRRPRNRPPLPASPSL